MKQSRLKRGTGFKALAPQLKQLIDQSASPFLPSFRELSVRFNANLHTISRAVRLLQNQEILDVAQGRRVRILKQSGGRTSSVQEQPLMAASAAESLRNRVREDIGRGVYRCGDAMPKFAHFALTMHLANDTVSAAFKMLNGENLIHKAGKRWIVGARNTAESRNIAHFGVGRNEESSPVILILFENAAIWNDFIMDEYLSPFLLAFQAEIGKCGFICRMVQHKKLWMIADSIYPAGRMNILECIRHLGGRYAGTLVQTESKKQYKDFRELISRLCGFKKPVILADIGNWFPRFDRRAVGMSNFFRCFMDEGKAVAVAFDALYRAGHTAIGIPGVLRSGRFPLWYPKRLDFILNSALVKEQKLDLHLEVKAANPWDNLPQRREPMLLNYIDRIYTRLTKEYPAESDSEIGQRFRRKLIEMAPDFIRLVARPGLTALLAPNQWIGVCCLHWLINAGISIPRDLSIVMFDNFPQFNHLHISTVDFGFDLLGYKAAHVFIGDIPIYAERYGNIATQPLLCNRGSLGPPRKTDAPAFG